MPTEAVRLEGARRLRTTLRKAGADLGDLTALHRQVAGIIAPVAAANAPVGPDVGGHIAATVRVGATQRAAIVRVGSKRMPYAGPIHFGWPAHHIQANPWVSNAAQATEGAWVETYWDGLLSIMHKIEGI